MRTLMVVGSIYVGLSQNCTAPPLLSRFPMVNHVKRSEKAHMITLQALFAFYLDEFLKTLPELRHCVGNLLREVIEAFRKGKKEKIERALQFFVGSISSS